ncbi:MAG: peptidylprolyl isomerase [cyanobacterium endosymbiont of Rhopalodia musculus]|uniref:peptidylprolyl isomerase n=1 Tax=cyanobacterium endosymbiont of Epithemia clementina EcSB TaxID=3034674 RepID=UPI0024817918|nr:peptidylprolyl isomerase [cyanobacterium endosymbiont of Epithemia clementina EcSB]WGT67831.1 peptidylprolyl isomerase [cyanobacterium endosymbiont of Epithemia clementina EcSB]
MVYFLIRTKNPGIAQEFYFRIQEGESSFEKLARRYSEDAKAQTGGLIGPVHLNVPHPQISRILSTSQLGQLSKPIQIGKWWIILRLERYLSAQLDKPTRKKLLNELFQGCLQNQMLFDMNRQ